MDRRAQLIVDKLCDKKTLSLHSMNAKYIISLVYPIMEEINEVFPNLSGAEKHCLTKNTLDYLSQLIEDKDVRIDAQYTIQTISTDIINSIASAKHNKYHFKGKKTLGVELDEKTKDELVSYIYNQLTGNRDFDLKKINVSNLITITRRLMELASLQSVQGFSLTGMDKSKLVDEVMYKVINYADISQDDKANLLFMYQLTAESFKSSLVNASQMTSSCCVLI
jgi:hypothetical protein